MTTDPIVHSPKKLIEVMLPLDEINAACVREKSIRHGHPSTMHLWWARRPLAAARAVIFASMVNDPGYVNKEFRHGVNKEEAQKKREELCEIIKDLVIWENTNNPEVLAKAREAMMESWREICRYNKDHPRAKELFNPDKLPAFHDPFAGGGALPLEAQRLGLESYASDLNPVPVLINKAMIEIPPKFAGKAPSGPIPEGEDAPLCATWEGNTGLAEDIRRYGLWMRKQALKKIGKFYPEVEITEEMTEDRPDLKPLVGRKFPVIAWIWARTVKSPNPLYADKDVPLVSTFILSKKENEAYIEPQIKDGDYQFVVRTGKCPVELENGTSAGKRSAFKCLLTGTAIPYDYIRHYGQTFGFGDCLLAVVLDSGKGRLYLSPNKKIQAIAQQALPRWTPRGAIPKNETRDFKTPSYGMNEWKDLFTPRQLLALTTFSDLIRNDEDDQAETVIKKAEREAIAAGLPDDGKPLSQGGTGARAYAEAIGLYMAFVIDKCSDYWSTVCTWNIPGQKIRNTFGRQAIPMTWDYAETNPFSCASGGWHNMLMWVSKAVGGLPYLETFTGKVFQADAQTQSISQDKVVSTDPPYYDNVGYADLSDYFYVWLRRSVKVFFPDVCGTLSTPKQDELIASQYRHKNKEEAGKFFLDGMTSVMSKLADQAHPAFPVTIYYAFKQSETKLGSTTNAGWVTFLEAVIRAGFQITGTWPMRTERTGRTIAVGTNALASSIVLVCRKRPEEAPSIETKQFRRELNARLTEALGDLVSGTKYGRIAPVDLSQAIIGPGMEIFSKYSSVLEANGESMSVDKALCMINNFLDEDAFDPDTQFCLTWFKDHQWDEADFGSANQLATSKGLSVAGLANGGVLTSGKGKVQLIHWKDLPKDWNPEQDSRISLWEVCHHLIRAYHNGGIFGAARLFAKTEPNGNIPMFCTTMYTLCERNGWNEDAMAYNALSVAWSSIESSAEELRKATPTQGKWDF